MVDGGEPGVDSKDEGKHTGRNDHYCCCRDAEREYDANEDHDSDSDVPSVRGNHRLTGNEDDSIDYDD